MVRSSRGWSHYWNDPLLKCGPQKRDRCTACVADSFALRAWIDLIQHPVRRDFRQHDVVGNAQQGVARTTVQMIHQVMDHYIDRGQRLDEIDREGFGRGVRVDGEQGAGSARGGFDVGGRGEVEFEGAFGSLVEFRFSGVPVSG